MFKVLGWGGGCAGGCHMKFSDNPESKLAFPNWGSFVGVGTWTSDLDSGLSNLILIFY